MSNKICVLSGRYPASKFDSYVNHKIYCDIHGYTYINCNWPTKAVNRYMNKVEYIKSYYGLFDYIFWIDDDAFFIDMEKNLDCFLPTGNDFLSICASPSYKKIHTYVSSGQFVLRCSDMGRRFVDAIPCVDLMLVKNWWNASLGYFSNGDQDAMVYLLKENLEFKQHFRRWHYKNFNSRADEIYESGSTEGIFILHFTGTPEKKQEDYANVQKILKRSPSLVAEALECAYSLVVRKENILKRLMNFFLRGILIIKDGAR